jgi:EEF1A lysine methyltransferase 4
MRAHVNDPQMIHNIDYSSVAIEVGRAREVEMCASQDHQAKFNEDDSMRGDRVHHSDSVPSLPELALSSSKCMRWSAVDLLDCGPLLSTCRKASYSIIVDKSTSDSVACADDVLVSLPYSISTFPVRRSTSHELLAPMPPLYLLAIHMAVLTKPKARWVSLSYSQDRYSFLNNCSDIVSDTNTESPASPQSIVRRENSLPGDHQDGLDQTPNKTIDTGFPNPASLWTVVSKHEIEARSQELVHDSHMVHRPKILHWVYILERTDVSLFVIDP